MGRYVNSDSRGYSMGADFEAKKRGIEADGGVKVTPPTEFVPNLVCVVDNGFFAAAAYAYSESEMNEFLRPDGRRKQWYTYEHAENVAN